MATMFAVFSSTLETVYDPIFSNIDFEVDVEGRRGRYAVLWIWVLAIVVLVEKLTPGGPGFARITNIPNIYRD